MNLFTHSRGAPSLGIKLSLAALATLVAIGLSACSSKEEKQAKRVLRQMTAGCLQSGVPKEMCQCLFEESGMEVTARMLGQDRNNEEARVTFVSKIELRMRDCSESVYGITPPPMNDAQRRSIASLIPR